MIYIAAYSGYLFFSTFLGYNIHSLGGAIKLFSRFLWVVDAAYSAINFFPVLSLVCVSFTRWRH